jgi:hypothetical protein
LNCVVVNTAVWVEVMAVTWSWFSAEMPTEESALSCVLFSLRKSVVSSPEILR